MNAKTLEAWWNRPMTTRVLDRCDKCERMCEEVKERTNYWPYVSETCCEPCFTKLIDAAKTGGH